MRSERSMGGTVASCLEHELNYSEWARRFDRHLSRLQPELTFLHRLWTALHWLHRWDFHRPESAAEVSARWWSDAATR